MAEATPKAPKKTAAKAAKPETASAKTEATKPAPKKTVAKNASPAAVSKPVAEKKSSPAKPAAAAPKAAAPRKPAAKKAASAAVAAKRVISDEQRYRMIAEAAYYRAESCQFKSDPLRDWIEAERDIAILLSENE